MCFQAIVLNPLQRMKNKFVLWETWQMFNLCLITLISLLDFLFVVCHSTFIYFGKSFSGLDIAIYLICSVHYCEHVNIQMESWLMIVISIVICLHSDIDWLQSAENDDASISEVILVISNLRLYLNSSTSQEKQLERTKTFPKLVTMSLKGVYTVVQNILQSITILFIISRLNIFTKICKLVLYFCYFSIIDFFGRSTFMFHHKKCWQIRVNYYW